MNPYIQRGMITDPSAFYGRKRELESIFALLEAPACINIVGNRRVGKSSMLAHIGNPAVYRAQLRNPDDYLFVLLDLQELAQLDQGRFYATLINRATEVSGGSIVMEPQESVTYQAFRRFVREHCQPNGRWKLICCFDEFERMAGNPEFDVDFFTQLRALTQLYRVAYVISSRVGIDELVHIGKIHGSQFWNIFVRQPLGLFPADEFHELVTQPFEEAGFPLSAEEQALIHELAGRFPFFIQISCFHLFAEKRAKSTLSAVDYAAVRDRFTHEVIYHFGHMWQQLEEEDQGKAALAALALGEPLDVPDRVIRGLAGQSYVVATGDGWQPFSEAFARYVREEVEQERGRLRSGEPRAGPVPAEGPGNGRGMAPRGPSLSICLWSERSAVVELRAERRYFAVCPLERRFDASSVEDWRRRAQEISEDRSRWRERLRRLGSELFRQLVIENPKIVGALAAGLPQGVGGAQPLELMFRTPREMLGLPLELLYAEDVISGEEGPLALLYPLARYVTDAYFQKPAFGLPLRNGKGLRVLILAGADGGSVVPLDLTAELESLSTLLRSDSRFDQVDTMFSRDHAFGDVQSSLADGQYDIIHYAGHAWFDSGDPEKSGLMFFEKGAGSPVVSLTASALQDLLRSSPASLFFLNACATAETGDSLQGLERDVLGLLDALVVARMPTIVAQRWPVTDQSARRLAEAFYQHLLTTGAPNLALWAARRTLARTDRNDPVWASPVLIQQEG